ncbi:NXPE family member 3-like [Dreissena polymorpha]|uniref:NXPE family member 3-like n=1 Tax=Dreissena polymorpha TaxID=45954 RepID=UPI0022656E40|nr:NXPE family member 3-like [Dreissena polymorpha]
MANEPEMGVPEVHSGKESMVILEPYAGLLTEVNALQCSPCTSMDGVSDATRSTVDLKYDKRVINVGDMIPLMITTRDYAGNFKRVGGDFLKIFLCNDHMRSAIRGRVIDHGNGTYTAEVEAAWSGKSEVIVTLSYPREAITAMYRTRKEMVSLEYIYAGFQNGNMSEETICHPYLSAFEKGLNYSEVCNLTYENSGMPWYCGKPRNIYLLCEDWYYSHVSQGLLIPLTEVERELLNRGPVNFTQSVKVFVQSDESGGNTFQASIRPCGNGNSRLSWSPPQPTGFVYNGEWRSRLCRCTLS